MKLFNFPSKVQTSDAASVTLDGATWVAVVNEVADLDSSDIDPYLTSEEIEKLDNGQWYYGLLTLVAFKNGYRFTVETPELDNQYFEVNKYSTNEHLSRVANETLAKIIGSK